MAWPVPTHMNYYPTSNLNDNVEPFHPPPLLNFAEGSSSPEPSPSPPAHLMPHPTKKVIKQTHRSSAPCEAQQQRLAMTSHAHPPVRLLLSAHTPLVVIREKKKKNTRLLLAAAATTLAAVPFFFWAASCFRLAFALPQASWAARHCFNRPFRTSFLGGRTYVRTQRRIERRKKNKKTNKKLGCWSGGLVGRRICQRCGVNSAATSCSS